MSTMLRCPECGGPLVEEDGELVCDDCGWCDSDGEDDESDGDDEEEEELCCGTRSCPHAHFSF